MVEHNMEEACIDDITLAGYIEGRLGEKEYSIVQAHLDECNSCLGSLAFYYKSGKEMAACEKKEMDAYSLLEKKAVQKLVDKRAKQTIWDKLRVIVFCTIQSKITNLKSKIKIPLPAYAVSIAAIVLLLVNLFYQPEKVVIIENTQFITISKKEDRAPPPSYAFMDDGRKIIRQKYKDMRITAEKSSIVFKWRKIIGADSYDFAIKETTDREGKKIIFARNAGEAEIKIPKNTVLKNRRYLWVLSGALKDGKTFRAE